MKWLDKLDSLEYVLKHKFNKSYEMLEKFIFGNVDEFVTFNRLVNVCKDYKDICTLAGIYARKI